MVTVARRAGWSTAAAAIVAAFWVGSGLWAFLAPRSFYERLATFPPYNVHFLHDIGSFSIGLGAVIVLALLWQSAWRSALLGVGIGSSVHVLSHVIDADVGGSASDVVGLVVLTAVTFAAAFGERPTGGSRRRGSFGAG